MIQALKQRHWKKAALTFFTILISVGILFALLYREREVLLTYDWDLNWAYIFAAMVILIFGLIAAALIWADMMRSLGSRVSTSDHVRYYAISQLAKRLPGTIWYVAGRGYLYKQHGESVRMVTVASSLELVISVVSGAALTLALATYILADLPSYYRIGLIAAALVGMAATHPRVIDAVLHRLGIHDAPKVPYANIIRWLLLYLIPWLVGGLVLYLIAISVLPLPLSDLPYVMGAFSLVGTLSVLVIFLPSNFGFTEVGLSLLLSAIMPSSFAVLIAVLTRVLMLVYELIGLGLITLFMRWRQGEEVTG